MTIRYGIRWDGRGLRKLARTAALGLAALALIVRASVRAQDPGDTAATASMQRIAGGPGIAPDAADGTGVDVALTDSGVVPVGGLAQPGRVLHGPDFSSEQRDRRRLARALAEDDDLASRISERARRRWSGRRWSGASWIPD